MSNPIETLLFLYQEQIKQSRHYERQRATLTNCVLVVTGATLVLLHIDGLKGSLPVGVFLVGLGIWGCVTSAKYYERYRYYSLMAEAYRRKIEEIEVRVEIDRDSIRQEQVNKFPIIVELRLYRFSILFHLFISFLGFAILISPV